MDISLAISKYEKVRHNRSKTTRSIVISTSKSKKAAKFYNYIRDHVFAGTTGDKFLQAYEILKYADRIRIPHTVDGEKLVNYTSDQLYALFRYKDMKDVIDK